MGVTIDLLPWVHPENKGKLEMVNVQLFREEATPGKTCVVFELEWQGKKLEGLWNCWIPEDLKQVSLEVSAWEPMSPLLVSPSATYEPMRIDPFWLSGWVANGILKPVV